MAVAFDPRSNIVGAQRLGFALLVILSHSFPLGYAATSPLSEWSRGQTDLGTLAVTGFFVLSGFLIVGSAGRTSIPRFAWHRFLRIFPGFWACLLVTALVLAPALHYVREDTLAGFWSLQPSPAHYVTANFWTSMRQPGIGELLVSTPFGGLSGTGAFNGSLWSLRYELLCYVLVLATMTVGAARRRTALQLVVFGVLIGLMLQEWVGQDRFGRGTSGFGIGVWPLVGAIDLALLIPLAAVFLFGGLAAGGSRWFVVDARVAVLAAGVALATMRFGGFDVVGLLAFAYVVLWMATMKTRGLRRVGVRQDWSYGVYIYAFPIQQVLALVGVPRLGHVVYVVVATVLALLAGFASWHLVEKRALRLKHLTLRSGPSSGSG